MQMMNQSTLESHRKYTEMEEKISYLENEENTLEQQLQNQNEELVAARINIHTQQTKISMIEKSIHGQQNDLEKLHRDLEAAGSGATGAKGDPVSSQMEEILNTVREHEMRVNNLQSELTRLKETRLTPKINDARFSSGHQPCERRLDKMEEILNTVRQHETRLNNLHKELVLLTGTRMTSTDFELRPNLAASHPACERRLDRTEHQLALHEIQLSEEDLQIQILQATSYDGVYLWKIDQYSRRFQDAVSGKTPSIYSPPFYVGRFGYKVCARLYLNGDGMGEGTHVSVFFVIMRGEYDALLPWPFTQKVHFKLLDQDRFRHAYHAFRPDPQSPSFKRPTSDMNIASGCRTFLSHRELRQGGYVQEDTIFVKIMVDTSSLQGDEYFDSDSQQHFRKHLPAITHPDNQISATFSFTPLLNNNNGTGSQIS